MSIFVSFNNNNCISWDLLLTNKTFKTVVDETPNFVCAEFDGIQILEWDNLEIEDTANKARAGGVDTANINGIISELQRGYRATEMPPIVMILPDGQMQLWDGYNRFNAARELGVCNFPFAVYVLKEEWEDRVEDAYDIVSLGANNHTVAKRHSQKDFITRGIAHFKRHAKNPSKQDIYEWISAIDHSFTDKMCDKIVNDIYSETTVAVNIRSFSHPKIAQGKFSEIVDTNVPGRMLVCAKEDGYMTRTFMKIVRNYIEKGIKTEVVFYTKSCETAEEVLTQRKDAINALIEKYESVKFFFQLCYGVDLSKEIELPFIAEEALPQLIGIEDPLKLVKIDMEYGDDE